MASTSVVVVHHNHNFLPSETARLVLGYLNKFGCKQSYSTFLNESPDLQEYRLMVAKGHLYPTDVNGKSLMDILSLYCIMQTEAQTVMKRAQKDDKKHGRKSSKTGRCKTQNVYGSTAVDDNRLMPLSDGLCNGLFSSGGNLIPILPKPSTSPSKLFTIKTSSTVLSPEKSILPSTSMMSVNSPRKSRKSKLPKRFCLPQSIIPVPRNATSIDDAVVIDKVLERLFTSPHKIADSINHMDSSKDILQGLLSGFDDFYVPCSQSQQLYDCHSQEQDMHVSLSDLLFGDNMQMSFLETKCPVSTTDEVTVDAEVATSNQLKDVDVEKVTEVTKEQETVYTNKNTNGDNDNHVQNNVEMMVEDEQKMKSFSHQIKNDRDCTECPSPIGKMEIVHEKYSVKNASFVFDDCLEPSETCNSHQLARTSSTANDMVPEVTFHNFLLVSSADKMSTPNVKCNEEKVGSSLDSNIKAEPTFSCDLDESPCKTASGGSRKISRNLTSVLTNMDHNTSFQSSTSSMKSSSSRSRYVCSYCRGTYTSIGRLHKHIDTHKQIIKSHSHIIAKEKPAHKQSTSRKQKLKSMNIAEFLKTMHK